jgi:hypothetical protein
MHRYAWYNLKISHRRRILIDDLDGRILRTNLADVFMKCLRTKFNVLISHESIDIPTKLKPPPPKKNHHLLCW